MKYQLKIQQLVSYTRCRIYRSFLSILCSDNRCTLDVLNHLQASNHITYKTDSNSQYIRFKINNWKEFNTALEADSPCYMEEGFFFFPYKMIDEFIGHGKCTEMDILLDLWVHTVYKDERVAGFPGKYGTAIYMNNYLSPQEFRSNDDVVAALVDAGFQMCRKTMTAALGVLRTLAVDCLSYLWGYTAKELDAIVERFV